MSMNAILFNGTNGTHNRIKDYRLALHLPCLHYDQPKQRF